MKSAVLSHPKFFLIGKVGLTDRSVFFIQIDISCSLLDGK